MRVSDRAAPKPIYEPDNSDRLDAVGEHLLALLAEPPDEMADRVASCGRKPPADGQRNWHAWVRLGPRLFARAGLVASRNRCCQIAQWSCWRLFRRGAVSIATTPMAGCRGRLRFVRLSASVAGSATPAHPWSVPGAHVGASFA
jgi:hypothetical protein